MFGVNFQREIFLPMTILCLSLLGHSYELQSTGYSDNVDANCNTNQILYFITKEELKHDVNETKPPMKLTFLYCRPPKKPYIEKSDDHVIDESLFVETLIKEKKNDGSINSTGILQLEKGSKYLLDCYDDQISVINDRKPITFLKPYFNATLDILFNVCTYPNVSYSNILEKNNITPSSVQEFILKYLPDSFSLKPDAFKGLSLRNLSVICDNMCEVDSKVFEGIEIDELLLKDVALKTMKKFSAKKVTMQASKFSGEWGDCSALTSLILERFVTPETPGWLQHCHSLTDLNISWTSREKAETILLGVREINTLVIERFTIKSLMKPFKVDAVNLTKLKFQGRVLTYISARAFKNLTKLEEIDLSDNILNGNNIFKAITPLKNLRKLSADRNVLRNFCDDYQQYILSLMNGGFTPQRTVEHVSLRYSLLSEICFNDWQNLSYLDLSYNNISSLQLTGLPAPKNSPLTVDLRGNQFKTLPEKFSYENTVNHFQGSKNITILLNWTTDCDCEHTSYVKALRNLPQITLENATCTSGERLVDFENFGCYKYRCHNCTCRTWENGNTIAYCDSTGLDALPAVWEFLEKKRSKDIVVKIFASKNSIRTLPKENVYPDSLVDIDLRHNNITQLSNNELKALFYGSKRRVFLSGNPFVCTCETQAMLTELSIHSVQIPDYSNLKCVNQDSYLHEFGHRSLCVERILITSGIVVTTLLALCAIIALFFIRFKLTLKACLYASGFCLSCVREEELDEDKEYDAFVSFSHGDHELVEEVLLPRLENEYKICAHTRNWIPGEMIYTQIIESVEKSRRTIIVLSKNFVQSVWGMLEFRTAHVSALHEGRVRVICIVVDDVIDDMDLEPDLITYLKSHTYLKWKDPWFWQKLRYAMPHPCVNEQSGVQNKDESEENISFKEITLAFR